MRFALMSDSHLHNYSGPQVRINEAGVNSRLQDIIDAMKWMQNIAVERGCDTIIHGGDLFHSRKSMANEAWEHAAQFMRNMNQAIPTYVLVGNHDYSASGDGTSTVKALDGLINAVTKVKVIDFSGYKIGFIPYLEDPILVREAVEKLLSKGAKSLVGHLGIGDPKFSSCVPTDYETPGRINVSDLSTFEFDQVFLGHYHSGQPIGDNARYGGSPLQLSFKEAGQVKGLWIFDTDKQKVEFIENKTSPQFHIIDGAEDKLSSASDLDQAVASIKDTDFVWLKNVPKGLTESLHKDSEKRLIPLRIDQAPPVTNTSARITDSATSDNQVLEEFTRIKAPQITEEERAALVKVGLELKESV